jgi:hypothetical protein
VTKLRWAKFFWADWADDSALALCSLTAQGVWMRLLCIAVQSSSYGTVLIGGRQPTDQELASLMRPRMKPSHFRRALAELERNNVAKRDPNGALTCLRLVRDSALTRSRQQAGISSAKKRGTSNLGHYSSHGLSQQNGNFVGTRSRSKRENPPQGDSRFCVPEADVATGSSRPPRNGAGAPPARPEADDAPPPVRHPAARRPGESHDEHIRRLLAMPAEDSDD